MIRDSLMVINCDLPARVILLSHDQHESLGKDCGHFEIEHNEIVYSGTPLRSTFRLHHSLCQTSIPRSRVGIPFPAASHWRTRLASIWTPQNRELGTEDRSASFIGPDEVERLTSKNLIDEGVVSLYPSIQGLVIDRRYETRAGGLSPIQTIRGGKIVTSSTEWSRMICQLKR